MYIVRVQKLLEKKYYLLLCYSCAFCQDENITIIIIITRIDRIDFGVGAGEVGSLTTTTSAYYVDNMDQFTHEMLLCCRFYTPLPTHIAAVVVVEVEGIEMPIFTKE